MLEALADGSMFGARWGTGPAAVVALHGWRRTHADFAPAFAAATGVGGRAVLALDLPGFGSSPPPPEAWGSSQYAALVASVVDHEVAGARQAAGRGDPVGRPPVVVGHSFGGRVAVALAAARPELVSGLVLTGAPLVAVTGRRRPAGGFRVVRALRRAGLVSEERLERARRRYGSEDYRLAEGVMRAVLVRLLGERYEEQLQGLRCPTVLVWGDDDSAAPLEVGRALEQTIVGARLVVCPGAGHLVPVTAPEAIREAVGSLLGA